MLGPLPPVMVSCRLGEKDNIFTAAWTGTINTRPPKTYVSIRDSRFSHNIIKERTVNVRRIIKASWKPREFLGQSAFLFVINKFIPILLGKKYEAD